jgi:hypothetical protein
MGFTSLWGLSSLLTLFFQCRVPQVWNILSSKCIDRNAFWDYSNVVNIIIDACLIGLPVVVVWNLQMAGRRKVVIFGTFAARAL